jgi:hypothetical protein
MGGPTTNKGDAWHPMAIYQHPHRPWAARLAKEIRRKDTFEGYGWFGKVSNRSNKLRVDCVVLPTCRATRVVKGRRCRECMLHHHCDTDDLQYTQYRLIKHAHSVNSFCERRPKRQMQRFDGYEGPNASKVCNGARSVGCCTTAEHARLIL